MPSAVALVVQAAECACLLGLRKRPMVGTSRLRLAVVARQAVAPCCKEALPGLESAALSIC